MLFASDYFHFSLEEKAKQWYFSRHEKLDTWKKNAQQPSFSNTFQDFIHIRIIHFQQTTFETAIEAWKRYQGYVLACPNHEINGGVVYPPKALLIG